jgi:hypothetical protein
MIQVDEFEQRHQRAPVHGSRPVVVEPTRLLQKSVR